MVESTVMVFLTNHKWYFLQIRIQCVIMRGNQCIARIEFGRPNAKFTKIKRALFLSYANLGKSPIPYINMFAANRRKLICLEKERQNMKKTGQRTGR